MQAAKKVVLNMGILYGRMLLTIGVSLYTTRLVLNALGSTDYGIFNLVAGVVAMLSFLNNAMAISTQRFLSFHQGKGDPLMQRKIFSNSVILHLIIGVLLVCFLELVGIFLFRGFLNIPQERLVEAELVYHFMAFSVFFSVLSVPFNASLIAHENMLWVAIVNIIETILKLVIALVLLLVHSNKLAVYGTLTSLIGIVVVVLYATYCFKKYDECTFEGFSGVDKKLLKELTSFASWNLFGSLCWLGRTQGLAIILNLFFGAIINTSYGISNQVSSQLTFFSTTMLRAINPQIMKSEGNGERYRMLRLSMMASKFSFFLFAFFSIPCIFEMEGILNIWLQNTPPYAVIFCNLTLVATLVSQLTVGLQSAAQAIGDIKKYQAVIGSIVLLNIPISYCFLELGAESYSVLIIFTIIEFIASSIRIYFIAKIGGLSIREYVTRVFAMEVLPVVLTVLACFLVTTYIIDFTYRFIITILSSSTVFILSVYFGGLCKDEKDIANRLLRTAFNYLRTTSFKLKSAS